MSQSRETLPRGNWGVGLEALGGGPYISGPLWGLPRDGLVSVSVVGRVSQQY